MRKQDEVVSVEMTKEQLWALNQYIGNSSSYKRRGLLEKGSCEDTTVVSSILDTIWDNVITEPSRIHKVGTNFGCCLNYDKAFPKSNDELTLEKIAELEQKVAELKATVTKK